jgi:UDP-glucose-4-epimerase GalE
MRSNYVLVIGGAGYIGSNICAALWTKGYKVVVLDDLSTGSIRNVKFGPLEKGDFGDPDRVKDVLVRHKPVAVVHAAGSIQVGESETNPEKYYSNNLVKSISLLNCVRDFGPKPFIFSSTAAVYQSQGSKLNEQSPVGPVSTYGKSKKAFEDVLISYSNAYGIKPLIFRYFNAAGANMKHDLGIIAKPYSHLIPSCIERAFNNEPILIFGDHFNTPDGSQIRDFIDVMDIAEAHVKAVDIMLTGQELPKILNLSTGNGTSVKTVISTLEATLRERFGLVPVVVVTEPRRGDPEVLFSDPSLAENSLEWKASRSVNQIIESTINFMIHNGINIGRP